MALEVAAQTPARMSIANVSSGESIEAQFNPTELEEALEVNWARQTVPGLSHQPLQFCRPSPAPFGQRNGNWRHGRVDNNPPARVHLCWRP